MINKIIDFITNLFNMVLKFIVHHPFYFALILILLFIIIDYFRNKRFNKLFMKTKIFIRIVFGYTIYITAKIRKGKTTLMSALSHVLTEVLISSATSELDNIESMIPEADWNDIHNIIKDGYDNEIYFKEVSSFIVSKYPFIFGRKLEDPVNINSSYQELLDKYVEASYSLLRNSFVYSLPEFPIYNRITNSYSLELDPQWLKIKEAYDFHNFALTRYSVICEDEKGMNQDKKESSYMQNASVDDGIPEFFRIIGNAGAESIYYITTNQDAARWVSVERKAMVTNIKINDLKVIRLNRFRMFLLSLESLLCSILYFCRTIFIFDKVKKINYKNRPNIFKKWNKKLVNKDRKLFAKSIVRYSISIYESVDDLTKKNPDSVIEKDLYFPLIYAFGNIDTHIYRIIFDELSRSSVVTSFDVQHSSSELSDEQIQSIINRLLCRESKAMEKKKKEKAASKENLEETNESLPF